MFVMGGEGIAEASKQMDEGSVDTLAWAGRLSYVLCGALLLVVSVCPYQQ